MQLCGHALFQSLMSTTVPPVIPRVGLSTERLHQVLSHHAGWAHDHLAHEVRDGGQDVLRVIGHRLLRHFLVGRSEF